MNTVLVAINAKYIHSNLAVYSLRSFAQPYTEDIEIAENFLRMSGASKIVRTSSYSHEGIQELMELIENLDLTDY